MKLFRDERPSRTSVLFSLLVIIAVCGTLQLFATYTVPGLRYERDAVLAGQVWRLLTGNLVHLGWIHLLLNLGTLLVFWLLFGYAMTVRQVLFGFLFACLGTGVGLLLFSPDINWYVGLSGSLYGLLVFGALASLRSRPFLASTALLLILIKLLYEILAGPLPGFEIIGANVVTDAHLYGAVSGLLIATGFGIRAAMAKRGRTGLITS
jgi:rhomboid family GlyGly-CTERM serine protease